MRLFLKIDIDSPVQYQDIFSFYKIHLINVMEVYVT
jgi:hypothetical protein